MTIKKHTLVIHWKNDQNLPLRVNVTALDLQDNYLNGNQSDGGKFTINMREVLYIQTYPVNNV